MRSLFKSGVVAGLVVLSGCSSIVSKPYSPAPEGVTITSNSNGGFQVGQIVVKRKIVKPSLDGLQFCFAQNIPGVNGVPLSNPSKTKITAQGKDQVTFVVPMTMGTPLSYDIMFSATASHSLDMLVLDYTNLRIKGTWSTNEAPLPGGQEASMYVDSALDKLSKISDSVVACLSADA